MAPLLSPRRVRQIKRTAARQASRTSSSRSDIASARASLAATRQQRRTDIRSVKGAQRIAERTLARGAAQLPSSGLKGRYLRQTAQEFASRREALAGQLPALIYATRQQYKPDIVSARSQIASARSGLQSDVASKEQSLLSDARTRARSRQAKAETATKAQHKSLHAAVLEANRLVRVYGFAQLPKNDQQWANFEGEVGKAEGVTGAAAAQAVHILRQQLGYTAPLGTIAGALLHPIIG